MESLASRTNVASLRAGSAARPASHLNRGRAAPVAVLIGRLGAALGTLRIELGEALVASICFGR